MDVKQWLKNKIIDDHVEAFQHKSTLNYINSLEARVRIAKSHNGLDCDELVSVKRQLEQIRHILNKGRYVPVKLFNEGRSDEVV